MLDRDGALVHLVAHEDEGGGDRVRHALRLPIEDQLEIRRENQWPGQSHDDLARTVGASGIAKQRLESPECRQRRIHHRPAPHECRERLLPYPRLDVRSRRAVVRNVAGDQLDPFVWGGRKRGEYGCHRGAAGHLERVAREQSERASWPGMDEVHDVRDFVRPRHIRAARWEQVLQERDPSREQTHAGDVSNRVCTMIAPAVVLRRRRIIRSPLKPAEATTKSSGMITDVAAARATSSWSSMATSPPTISDTRTPTAWATLWSVTTESIRRNSSSFPASTLSTVAFAATL